MATKLPTVAIIGRANAGKSSLFNRIMRSQQAIVAREAGTTRDNVIGKASYKGRDFWLVDTAGLKPAEDEFEASIQDQGRRHQCRIQRAVQTRLFSARWLQSKNCSSHQSTMCACVAG